MRKSESLWKRSQAVSTGSALRLWASAADRRCTLLIDAKELASRPLGPVRVRECNMALLLGPGCRAEHERPDFLYVNLVHWTNAQRTKGKYVRLDDKDAAIFSTPFHHNDQDLSKHTVIHPDVGIHMNRLVRLKVPSTVVELWRIWTAMLDVATSGAEAMATGPCRLCLKMGVEPVNLCGLCGCRQGRFQTYLSD